MVGGSLYVYFCHQMLYIPIFQRALSIYNRSDLSITICSIFKMPLFALVCNKWKLCKKRDNKLHPESRERPDIKIMFYCMLDINFLNPLCPRKRQIDRPLGRINTFMTTSNGTVQTQDNEVRTSGK